MKELIIKGRDIGAGRRPLICVSLMGGNDEEIMTNLSSILEESKKAHIDIIEFRGDFYGDLEKPEKLGEILAKVRGMIGDIILLFTIRSPREGGENREYHAKSIYEINRFVVENNLADMIDMELFSAEASLIQLAKKQGVKIIMSNHDFSSTPDRDTILERLVKMQELGADIAKIAVMPNSEKDLITLLEATYEMKTTHKDIPIVTMSMGAKGALSRVVGEIFGSAITFAAVGKPSAPGQIPAKELDELLGYIHTYCIDK